MADEVRLRPVEDSDLDVFFENQRDPVAVRMAAVPARDHEAFTVHWAKIRTDETVIMRTVTVAGEVAGNILSWPQDGDRMLGYRLDRAFWGQGVATRALALFLDEVPARPLYAYVASHNVASARVLEKCGFRRDPVREAQAPPPVDGIEELIYVRADELEPAVVA